MILVIGGAGYIGSHTCKLLAQRNIPHVVFDNLSTGHFRFVRYGKFVQGDIQDVNALDLLFSTHRFSAVVHFAASACVPESVTNPQKYYHNNVIGTLNILNMMVKYNVKNLVYSSTCAVYGIPDSQEPMTEQTPQKPINAYGASKRATEDAIKDYSKAYGINYVMLRYFNASGNDFDCEVGEDHQPENHLIPNVIGVLTGKKTHLDLFGNDYNTPDGTCVRDYIHVLDLADAHIRAISYMTEQNKSLICNLGTGTGYSVLDIVKQVEELSGQFVKYVIKPRRLGDPDKLVADNTLAKQELGWTPQYKLKDIVHSALLWFNVSFIESKLT